MDMTGSGVGAEEQCTVERAESETTRLNPRRHPEVLCVRSLCVFDCVYYTI